MFIFCKDNSKLFECEKIHIPSSGRSLIVLFELTEIKALFLKSVSEIIKQTGHGKSHSQTHRCALNLHKFINLVFECSSSLFYNTDCSYS